MFIAGEDVGAHGGVFHTFDGVQTEFGERRAVDTPISEQAIIGLGIGAAVTGLRPIVDLMFMDFTLVAADQIANQAAKLKYMFGGTATLPADDHDHRRRRAVGGGAAQPEPRGAVLPHPGHQGRLPVERLRREGADGGVGPRGQPDAVRPAQAHARAERRSAEERYEVPLGVANVTRQGDDVTVVSWGKTANDSLAAADQLAADGIDAEVIDLRTLSPLDIDAVVASVRTTNRVVVAHEAVRFGGFGAEVAAQIQEHAFDYLDAPVGRVAAPYSPVPFTPALEQRYVPDSHSIAAGVRATMARPLLGG